MRSERIHQRLDDLVKTALADIRDEGGRMTEEEFLGVTLSGYLGWDGLRILKVAANALEDANYHAECEAVLGLLKDAKQKAKRNR